jgi:hypothetical protein
MVYRRFHRSVPVASDTEIAFRKVRWLIQKGHYARAGLILAQLARQAESLGRSRIAGELHCRAAYCLVEGGSEPAGLREAQSALRIYALPGFEPYYTQFFHHIVTKLQTYGLLNAIGTLRAEFGEVDPPPPVPAAARPLRLPAACLQCNAPIRSTEITWIDATSAECAYCGAVIHEKEN